ncbi:MAG TPA: hypothetical protein VNA14_09530 [Mycobacteriales bacterium]|nr:hypothetical protein [Mycobacteriales bacterium]
MRRVIPAAGALAVVALLGATVPAGAQSVPLIMSANVKFVANFPDTLSISGVFSRSAPYYYSSSLDSINVFDISNPRMPVLTGTLPNLVFENEAVSYGERTIDGTVNRFVLIGADLFNATPTQPADRPPNFLGGEVYIVDVTNPALPRIRSAVSASTSTHTVACADPDCNYAYTAGDNGNFTILDFRNLDLPVVLEGKEEVPIPSAKGPFDAGHHWRFESNGVGWHTGGGGATAYDVRDPANPVPLASTNPLGITDFSDSTPWNNFILHNAQHPNAAFFRPNAEPDVRNGNVLLVTEEDYTNDGDEIECDKAGSFETWYIPTLDAAAYKKSNPDLEPGRGTIEPIGIINPVQVGSGIDSPVGGFCSAHWFDYHQSGIIAQGFYQQGMRLIDVRQPRELVQYGFFTTGASEVWDAYFVPEYDAEGMDTGKRTNLAYTADLVRGMDVLEIELPPDLVPNPVNGRGATPAPAPAPSAQPAPSRPAPAPRPTGPLPATGADLGILTAAAAAVLGAVALRRRRAAGSVR